jgi:hypothetical protein
MAEGAGEQGTANKPQVDDLSITFVDSSYRVPRNVAERIHRLKLLLDEHPTATDLHFQELDDNRFKRVLEESSVEVVDPMLFRPEKQVKGANVYDDMFFKFMYTCFKEGKIATSYTGNFTAGFLLCAVPVESCLEDVLFSLSDFKSKKHNVQIQKCLYCPSAWWLERVGRCIEHSFVDKVSPRSNSVIANALSGHELRDVFITMYAAFFGETYAITVSFTYKEVK